MSKILSFKGKVEMGLEDRIMLRTLNGKTGYKINKFNIMSTTPGQGNVEMIGQLFDKSQVGSISSTVDFTNNELMAVAMYHDGAANDTTHFETSTIFDNEITNQNMFVSITDATGSTVACNYYIELEAIALTDIQSTQLTLKALRNVASR